MMEINNGKSKRMISLLARESTLAVLRDMRPGGWCTLGELAGTSAIEPGYLRRVLEELVEMGVLEGSGAGGGPRYRLLQPRITLSLDLRELPPGPGYILDVVRFYFVLLSNLIERCREAGGPALHTEALNSIALVRERLPDSDKGLLFCLRQGIERSACMAALEDRILAGDLTDADLGRVRQIYLSALRALVEGLLARVDESTGKLVLRLSARELLVQGDELVHRFDLLEGIPENYLKQV